MEIKYILALTGIILYILLLIITLGFTRERVPRAVIVSLLSAHIIPLPFFLMLFVEAIPQVAGWIFPGLVILIIIILILPMPGRSYPAPVPSKHMDERDTMFSRNELKPGTTRYDKYYQSKPGNLESDLRFRSKPGLLNERASLYNRFTFASANASFETVTAFFGMREKKAVIKNVDKNVIKNVVDDPAELTRFIKEWGLKLGAASVGVAGMKPYHYYTTGGRADRYGVEVKNDHRFGIAFTTEMDYELTSTAPQGGIVMESAHQYLDSGMIATQVAATLRNLGYEAKTHIDGNYDLVCPLVAKDAGLGEIGRMGLLITPETGPRVRISVVTTDAPLLADTPTHDDTVLDFCTICRKCAVACPSASIPHGDREEQAGGLRWKIDQESCFSYWCQVGTDCGRCMAVCPYSHLDNLFHRLVRSAIANNFIFRRIALKLDDLYYGTRPKSGDMPDWAGR